ncbi:MAG: dinitrogenase iron-molybdenum cofactor biosynthesis protein [Syntrophus sp. (in: bacteria)]|nr:dinitrogenase iron-molybdenum cofactor biosynthesis protein [Syntrophus sp. (in: bacteria)]
MNIAITSTDGTLEGMVDERFGRSRKIIVYNKEKDSFDVIDNTVNMNSPQGAGIQTAQNVAKTLAQVVISGHLGPNAFRVLQAAGIEAYSASSMTVKEALTKLNEGSLSKMASADVKGHW